MNRISLIGMIFGLILISFLSFFAGFLSSFLAQPQTSMAQQSIAFAPQASSAAAAKTDSAKSDAPKSDPKSTTSAQPSPATAADTAGTKPTDANAPTQPDVPSTPSAYEIESDTLKHATQKIATPEDVGKFSVQLKTFQTRLWALQTQAGLKKLGYGAYVTQYHIKDSSYGVTRFAYDVRIGVFDSYVQANQFSRNLRKLGHSSCSVIMIASPLNIVSSDNG